MGLACRVILSMVAHIKRLQGKVSLLVCLRIEWMQKKAFIVLFTNQLLAVAARIFYAARRMIELDRAEA